MYTTYAYNSNKSAPNERLWLIGSSHFSSISQIPKCQMGPTKVVEPHNPNNGHRNQGAPPNAEMLLGICVGKRQPFFFF